MSKAYTTPYSALPLQPTGASIRLPSLHAGGFEAPLRGSLTVVELKNSPQYDALSYAWGRRSPGSQATILLNDNYPLPTTDNLFAALRRLRRRFRIRRLWIDAICINQDDLEERSHQVFVMDQVYGSA